LKLADDVEIHTFYKGEPSGAKDAMMSSNQSALYEAQKKKRLRKERLDILVLGGLIGLSVGSKAEADKGNKAKEVQEPTSRPSFYKVDSSHIKFSPTLFGMVFYVGDKNDTQLLQRRYQQCGIGKQGKQQLASMRDDNLLMMKGLEVEDFQHEPREIDIRMTSSMYVKGMTGGSNQVMDISSFDRDWRNVPTYLEEFQTS